MKALILSGGAGTRLRPITHTSAKQLVPVANRPILFYAIDHMVEAGIKEIGIVIGDTGDEVRAAVGDGSMWGAKVTYIPQDAPLGLAHCVKIAEDFLGDEDFVMYLGDNLVRQGVKKFVDAFEADRVGREPGSGPAAQILLAKVPDPQRFGVAELNDSGDVIRLVEKPVVPPSDLALVGVYLFDASIHKAVAAIKPSPRGELEITDAIQWLIDNDYGVRSEVVEGYWKDLGVLDALLDGNSLMLEAQDYRIDGAVDEESVVDSRVVIEAGAVVTRSTVRGPTIIGKNTKLIDAYIGPFTSIADDCTLEGSEIEHSMILERTTVTNAGRIYDSLIGKEAEILRSGLRPLANRLMIGDHSKVDLA